MPTPRPLTLFLGAGLGTLALSFGVPRELHSVSGAGPGWQLGAALASADLDDDGVADLILGVPGHGGKGPQAGAVQLVSGQTGRTLRQVEGGTRFEQFGGSVAGLAAPGADRFAVGAPNAGQGGAGAVFLLAADGAQLAAWSGPLPGSRFGAALVSAGDLDGDQSDDLLVGSPGEKAQAGAVYVFAATGGQLMALAGDLGGDRFGVALAPLAGAEDAGGGFAVGAPGSDRGAPGGGAVYAYRADSTSPRFFVVDNTEGARFGEALAPAGDVDGDGTPDLLVGAPGARRARVLSGVDGKTLLELRGKEDSFSATVAGLDDLDGDGRPELLVGAPGADGGGVVRIFSGAGGQELFTFQGREASDRLGAALAATKDMDGDGAGDFLIGAPGVAGQGAGSGQAIAFAYGKGRRKPAAVATVESPVNAETPAEPGAAGGAAGGRPVETLDFAAVPAGAEGWSRVESEDGRWVLYGDVEPKLLRETAVSIDRFYQRLDALLGTGPASGRPAFEGPVTLALLAGRPQVGKLLREVADRWPPLEEWSRAVNSYPKIQHWNPLFAIVRHDASTVLVKRPEMQLVHDAVHLELVRRYGRVPYWVAEAIGFAMQEELVDGVYGYNFRVWEELDEEYHQGWEYGAREAFRTGVPTVAELARDSGTGFDDRRGYLQFGLATWMLRARPEKLGEFLQAIADERGPQPLEVAYEPATEVQEGWLRAAFGAAALEEAAVWWEGVEPTRGKAARIAAMEAAIAGVISEHRLKRTAKGRLLLHSDFPAQARAAAALAEKTLKLLETALGKPEPDAPKVQVMLFENLEPYQDLCEAMAKADPRQAAFLRASKSGTGFTLYDPPLAVYYHDVRVQEEARPDHSIAHNVAHLELYLRYGNLPLWLAEGLAVACEEELTGEVWGNWNRDGFVYSVSHAAWRGTAARMVREGKPALLQLYEYSARPYQEELAHLAYAFAAYGMSADKAGLQRLLQACRAEYRVRWVGTGRFQPDVRRFAAMVTEAFGDGFQVEFRRWWQNRRP
ncbi:MAG TPA: hypothetical protein VGC54_11165 [Planctomycetota bacterium]